MIRYLWIFATIFIFFAGIIEAKADGPYLDLKIAAVAPSTIRDASKVGQFDLDFSNGISGSFAAGWAFKHARMEAEVNLIGADFDIVDGGIDQTLSDGSIKTFMINAYYDLADDFIVIPYVGAGVGLGTTDLTLSSTGSHLAYQAMAGIKYNLSGNFWVGAAYRYMNVQTDSGVETFKSSMFMATFGIAF
jgi:opacity protein-like surface antigen